MTDHNVIDSVRRADPVADLERLPEPRHNALTLLAIAEKERAMKTITPRRQPSISPDHGRRWLRPVAAFSAALVLALGAIGVVAFVSGEDAPPNEGPVTASVAPTTTAPASTTGVPATSTPPTTAAVQPPATTAAPPVPLTLLDGTWTGHEPPVGFGSIRQTSLGLVALANPGVWISQDGVTWELSLEDASPATATERDGTVYVFGSVHTGNGSIDRFVWSTSNGADWTQLPLPAASASQGGIQSAAALDGMLVAAYPTVDSRDSSDTILYVSDNGTDWDVVEPEDSGLTDVALSNVIAYGGRFIAVGQNNTVDEDLYPWEKRSIYTSDTGRRWQPVGGSDFAHNTFPSYFAAVDGDTVYVGGWSYEVEGNQQPALWQSTDGRAFERITLDPVVDESWGYLTGVVPTAHGVLAVVFLGSTEDTPGRLVLLAGSDVTDMQVVEDPDDLFTGVFDVYPGAASSIAESIVIAGSRGEGPDWRPYLWIWTLDS